MGHRDRQLDVPHPLATNTGESHLYSATITDDTLVLDPLVFSAGTLPVPGRTEDPFTEETTLLGLESPVIDRLRILHLSPAP